MQDSTTLDTKGVQYRKAILAPKKVTDMVACSTIRVGLLNVEETPRGDDFYEELKSLESFRIIHHDVIVEKNHSIFIKPVV